MTEGKFEDLGISEDVLRAVRSIGWTEPTPVQIAAIPVGLEGADLLAQAQTGTGKTGTYGSIILSKTMSGGTDPSALVLVPTRELATQVCDQIDALSQFSGHKCFPVYGGVNIENQVKQLKKGADILVATPGRLKDLLERKEISLSSISIVVLDEADRMLDMGFAPSVNMILSKVPKKRQTMMFAATMEDDIKKLAVKHMINHRELLISKDEPTLDLTAQYFIMTTRESKRDELVHIIEDGYPKMIVFCKTKRKVDYLFRKMKRDEYSVCEIHGDMVQNKREKTLRSFVDGDVEVLIASDVAARGLDIIDVDVVVNYDVPADVESYIHRIGRTGRAGKNGRAITFVTEDDIKMLNAIEKKVGRRIVEIAPTSSQYSEGPKPDETPKARAKQIKQKQAAKKVAAETALKAETVKKEPKRVPVKKKFQEEVPAETSGRTLKGRLDRRNRTKAEIEDGAVAPKKAKPAVSKKQPAQAPAKTPKAQEPKREGQPSNGQRTQYPKPQGIPEHPKPLHSYVKIDKALPPEKDMSFDRIEISIGSDDGVDQQKLVKFVTKTSGIRTQDIGNIHIYENKSRVQVVRWRSQEVVDELFGQTYNGRRVMVYNLSDKQ